MGSAGHESCWQAIKFSIVSRLDSGFTDLPEVMGEVGLFADIDDWNIFQGDPALAPLKTLLLIFFADHLGIVNSTFS